MSDPIGYSDQELRERLSSIFWDDDFPILSKEDSDRLDEAVALVQSEVLKARKGMLDYFDQVSDNEDMNWKGLFADTRQLLQDEEQALNAAKSGEEKDNG